MATTPDLNEVAETLVDNGATYVAASAPSLVDEPAQLYYHLPAGTSDSQQETVETYLNEEVGHRPYEQQIGEVNIAGQPTPTCVAYVLHDGLHLYRRVPVYVAEGIAGLDPVALKSGVATVQETVATQPDFEPWPAETLRLEEIVSELADKGAASVEIAHEPLVLGEPTVRLRIPMVPAAGKPIVGPVDAAEIGDGTYPLNTTLTLNGPYGSTGNWTALYIGDNIRGLEPLSVEDGCEAARNLLAQAETADMLMDLNPPANH
jgi:hypothetical protein